ncbi:MULTISPECIES: helix-turn-helix transcriptional regulator [unclassified Streptomyces]|uniref:PadR family transcriptional regulator n=1 Tax=unclassified Streptomyces TaxID=2593676 RepID=UPI002E126BAB|nr:helix-turn-helix transcriptional regulator [Streptomyces sp. NBC_01186]WSS43800.1 helix-turn-helix transcriptional regulator [Streptomyces sp. NBC_01187]
MPPVFAHGRLRLYLLMLLDEAPRHGYEVIRLLEERFQGLYAPSAGTVYPRLAKLEAEGLVSHTTEGGRKVYAITKEGRAELADRQAELAELEVEIRDSLAALAADIREDVSGSASDLRREMREQARDARGADRGRKSASSGTWDRDWGKEADWGDWETWRQAKEEMRRAKDEWKEQARKAKEEAQQARRQAKKEREAHTAAVEEVQRVARQVQDQVQARMRSGDWPGAVRDGMSELAREMGNLGRVTGQATAWPPYARPRPADGGDTGAAPDAPPEAAPDAARTAAQKAAQASAEAHLRDAVPASGDPARDLERLLDRFRDDIRDAARDHGLTDDQLRDVRRHLSTAAAHIGAVLRPGDGGRHNNGHQS